MIYKYLARQAIMDANKRLYGYEMLYRNSEENFFPSEKDQNDASRSMISNLQTEFALKDVTGGRHAFINLPKELCMSGVIQLLDPTDYVIEILEDTIVDKPFIDRIADLKSKGYRFALDDYTGQPCFDPLMPHIDIIKVDFILADDAAKSSIAWAHKKSKRILAEKIENEEEFLFAKKLGYSLFQGYYFSKPLVLRKETLNIATATHIKLWQQINKKEPDYDKIEEIIIKDAGMTYKLLNKINTLEYYRANRISSVRQALTRMGLEGIKRWIMLVLLEDCIPEKNDDIYAKLALTRALFLETVMSELGEKEYANDAYMVGMFSVFDNDVNTALPKLLETMHVSPLVEEALMQQKDVLGGALRLTMQYETGEWNGVDDFAAQTGLRPERLLSFYRKAVAQAEDAFRMAAV